MNDNTKPHDIAPERRRQIVAQLSTLVTMVKAIVETIHDLGPTSVEIVYGALVNNGLVDSGSFERFIQLACATGEIKREGATIRPATKAEIRKHHEQTLAELVAVTKEIQARGL